MKKSLLIFFNIEYKSYASYLHCSKNIKDPGILKNGIIKIPSKFIISSLKENRNNINYIINVREPIACALGMNNA